jgi:hypothetical protein
MIMTIILDIVWNSFQGYIHSPALTAKVSLHAPIQYPPTPRTANFNYYKSAIDGEIAVANPYSWLETDSAERDSWVDGDQLAYSLAI